MEKLDRLGSLEANFRGLRLKGDEMSPSRGKVYGVSKTGQRGFHSLDELDPKVEGSIFGGDAHASAKPNNDDMDASGNPFGVFALGSTFAEETVDDDGKPVIKLYAFGRPIMFTAGGRAFKVGQEICKPICSISLSGGGETVSPRTDFEPSASGITGGVVCIARQYYKVAAYASAPANGSYRLSFTYNAHGGTYTVAIEAGDGFAAPTDDVSYAPLFELQDGKIVEDYRNAIYLMVRE